MGIPFSAGAQIRVHNNELYENSMYNFLLLRQNIDNLIEKFAYKYTKA